MDAYKNYSREELLDVVAKLESENERLRQASAAAPETGKEKIGSDAETGKKAYIPGSFKKRYAEQILDSLPDMLTVLNHSGTLVDLVSSEDTNHVGEPVTAIIGRDISSMLSPEAYQSVKSNLDTVAASGKGSTSHHNITLEGQTHHYENRIFPLDGENALCMCRDVTDEVRAKEGLEQANRRMTTAEEIASLSHWYYYEATEEFEAPGIVPSLLTTDDRPQHCPRETFMSFVHPADVRKLSAQINNPKTDDSYVEYRILLNDQVRYMHSRVIHTYTENGKAVVEGYAQDMTYIVERMHELEAVKYALNNAVEEIYACNLDGSIEFANREFIHRNNLFGDITKHRAFELETPRSNQRAWQERVDKIRENRGSYKYVTKYTNDDGKIVAMEVVTYIVYDHSREREIVWCFARDITIRFEHEERIRQLNDLMDAILNNIPVYLFVKDPGNEFRYLYWNKAFEDYSHIPASKALGHTDYETFPNLADAEKFRKDDLYLLKTGERLEFIEEYEAADGKKRIVSTSKALIPIENKLPLLIGVSWDITDLKNAEKELIAARIKAEESDRLKSAFLANMSHEIRTPLNAIVGFAKLIAEAETEEEKQQYSDIIDNNSDLLLQLINDILDISKIEAGTLEFNYRRMNLNDLCHEQYEVHKSRPHEGVELVFDEKYENVQLVGDYNRLAQVITNLINNASKFTHHGEIRYGFDIKGSMIEFYVSDTGTGIPEERIHTIFDRFIKLDSFASGTGLGLAITKMIIEKMGGAICVESQENIGTTFRFTVPYRSEKQPASRRCKTNAPVPAAVPAKEGKKKILIAEDIDSNYMLMKAFIGKQYEVIRARNGREAVDLYKSESPDLILMDIKMPVMTGYEAIRIIRELSTDVPIIVVTAFAFETDKEKAASVGCNGYITKPISQAALTEKLEKYLGKQ